MEAIKKPTRTENTLSRQVAETSEFQCCNLKTCNKSQATVFILFYFTLTNYLKKKKKKKDSIYYMTGTSDAYSVQFQASARCGFAGG